MPEPEILPPGPKLSVTARPHPLSLETFSVEFPHGLTILAIVGENAVAVSVSIGGEIVPEFMWAHVRPKPGVAVVIIKYPQGGSAKSIFRLIAFAALAVAVVAITGGAAAGLAGFLPGTFAAGSISAGLLAAGVGLVGSLLINALIPPSTPSTSASASTQTLQGITGTSNQINRFGVIPCVVGTMQVFPPYAALPYTELSGDDQYLRCLFDCGYGNPEISDMKIGSTDLATYTDVQTEIGVAPTLFSQNVIEEPISASYPAATLGTSFTRTTGADADEIGFDLAFASGLFGVDGNGNPTLTTATIAISYGLNASGTRQTLAGATGLTLSSSAASIDGSGNLKVTNGERKAVRVGVRFQVPTGEYDVTIALTAIDFGGASSDNQIGDMTWTVLRTIRSSTSVSTTGTKKIALRIKATDQLNGNIDQFNCILSQPIPVWNGSAWVTETSDNPAYVFRWLARDSPANPRPVSPSRLDDDELIAWASECDANGFSYNNCIDQPTTMFALLKDVCAGGRAAFGTRDSKYTPVRDLPQSTPVQVFTPRNSWAFGGTRAFPDAVHGLRVQFVNPEANWQQDVRIVYDDGYGDAEAVAADTTGETKLATAFEEISFAGCTDADMAWRLGRYHLAVSRLRPNTYTWNADIENLVCNRGDLVQVANDVIGVGKAFGRIKAITADDDGNAIGVRLDEECFFDAGTSYGLRIRKADGTVALTQVTTDVDPGTPTKYLTLSTSQQGLSQDDLCVFGVLGSDVLNLIVTKIEPDADLAAKITAVDAAPAVLQAGAGSVPAWSSQVSGQPWLEPPPPPDLILVDSSQAISNTDDSGTTAPRMIVSVSGPGSGITRSGQPGNFHLVSQVSAA